MPSDVQQIIYTKFVFVDFLIIFKDFFWVRNKASAFKYTYFNWDNPNYQAYMLQMIQYLEPKFEEAHTLLFIEGEDVDEVIMFTKGSFKVGFNINDKQYFHLKYHNSADPQELRMDKQTKKVPLNAGQSIGYYEVSFSKASDFVYKICSHCEGFFIRQRNWD